MPLQADNSRRFAASETRQYLWARDLFRRSAGALLDKKLWVIWRGREFKERVSPATFHQALLFCSGYSFTSFFCSCECLPLPLSYCLLQSVSATIRIVSFDFRRRQHYSYPSFCSRKKCALSDTILPLSTHPIRMYYLVTSYLIDYQYVSNIWECYFLDFVWMYIWSRLTKPIERPTGIIRVANLTAVAVTSIVASVL